MNLFLCLLIMHNKSFIAVPTGKSVVFLLAVSLSESDAITQSPGATRAADPGGVLRNQRMHRLRWSRLGRGEQQGPLRPVPHLPGVPGDGRTGWNYAAAGEPQRQLPVYGPCPEPEPEPVDYGCAAEDRRDYRSDGPVSDSGAGVGRLIWWIGLVGIC